MARCSLAILISKPKFHFLVHLPAFIHRFGPPIIFSTERYESFNHVFRLSCIFSNRRAPSCDSCNAFSAQDCIKHITTGGWWFDTTTGSWAHAGQMIIDYLSTHEDHMHWLGLPKGCKSQPGELLYSYPAPHKYSQSLRRHENLSQETRVRTTHTLHPSTTSTMGGHQVFLCPSSQSLRLGRDPD